MSFSGLSGSSRILDSEDPATFLVLVCVSVVNSHVEHQLLDLSVQPRVIKNSNLKITQRIVN